MKTKRSTTETKPKTKTTTKPAKKAVKQVKTAASKATKPAAAAKPAATRKPVAAAKPKTVKAEISKKTTDAKPVVASTESGGELTQILKELQAIRAGLAPAPAPKPTNGDPLEHSVDSMRRLLSELLSQHNEWILGRLVSLREDALDAPKVLEGLDELLGELGAIRFGAESLDFVDPLVHTVVEERADESVSEGVILETVRPGYRTGNGAVLVRANVAISRRN